MKARPQHGSRRRKPAAGFTLVEMLVVTTIIVILLSLISAAVFSAVGQARITRIAMEGQGLTQAFQSFQAKYGAGFPPADLRLANPPQAVDGVDNDSDGTIDEADEAEPIFKYVQRLFPRYDAATNLYTDLVTDEGINVATFDPGYALVFWLVGFSGDPADPFRDHRLRMGLGGAAPELEKAHYDFNPDRLANGRYFPPIPGDVADRQEFEAFLYFDASDTYGGKVDTNIAVYQGFRPYRNGGTSAAHFNSNSIQIISAGLDKKLGHGTGSSVPTWSILDCSANPNVRCEDDADNITNFAEGNTLLEFTEE